MKEVNNLCISILEFKFSFNSISSNSSAADLCISILEFK